MAPPPPPTLVALQTLGRRLLQKTMATGPLTRLSRPRKLVALRLA